MTALLRDKSPSKQYLMTALFRDKLLSLPKQYLIVHCSALFRDKSLSKQYLMTALFRDESLSKH
jgi:hypothetical protein